MFAHGWSISFKIEANGSQTKALTQWGYILQKMFTIKSEIILELWQIFINYIEYIHIDDINYLNDYHFIKDVKEPSKLT